MPQYEFKCKECGTKVVHILSVDRRHSKHKCSFCGAAKGLELQIFAPRFLDTYSPMHPRRGRGYNGHGRVDPGQGRD